jgi:hypothetical protein
MEVTAHIFGMLGVEGDLRDTVKRTSEGWQF